LHENFKQSGAGAGRMQTETKTAYTRSLANDPTHAGTRAAKTRPRRRCVPQKSERPVSDRTSSSLARSGFVETASQTHMCAVPSWTIARMENSVSSSCGLQTTMPTCQVRLRTLYCSGYSATQSEWWCQTFQMQTCYSNAED
jgi:hypothetical protein